MNERRCWFRRKRIGWGLEPGSREGWIATGIFVLVDTGGVLALIPFVGRTHAWIVTVWALGWLAAFLALVLAKGEPLW